MSRRRALRYRLSAYCTRLRPGTTAELASLVLQMSDEIDTRERMLDAALRPAPVLARPGLDGLWPPGLDGLWPRGGPLRRGPAGGPDPAPSRLIGAS